MGAKCQDCGQDMDIAETCTFRYVVDGDSNYIERNTSYYDGNERCHDCGIVNGRRNVHHFGCDMERCPRCGGQFAFCSCWPENMTLAREQKES